MKNKKLKILIVLLGISVSIRSIDYSEESFDPDIEKLEEATKPNKRQKLDLALSEVGLQEESKVEFESSDFIYGGSLPSVLFNENYENEAVLVESLSIRKDPKEIKKESQDSIEPAGIKERYTCEEEGCGKSYTEKYNLQRHIKSTHEGKKYPCKEVGCGKSYTQQSYLQRHIDSEHKGQKYNCMKEGCDKSFTYKGNLKAHIKAVHEVIRCACTKDGCGKSFQSKKNLQDHIRAVHDKEGKYVCTQIGCGKSYSSKPNIQNHIKAAHQGQKYTCKKNGCSKQYVHKTDLQVHIREKHSNKSVE